MYTTFFKRLWNSEREGVKESGIPNAWGVEHFGISEHMGG